MNKLQEIRKGFRIRSLKKKVRYSEEVIEACARITKESKVLLKEYKKELSELEK